MRKLYADLVRQTTATAGTGNITLASLAGWAQFSDRFSAADRVYYSIFDANGNKEVGFGTYNGGNILARTTILSTIISSVYTSGGSAINLSGSAFVQAVVAEDLVNQLRRFPVSFIAINTALANENSYGVQASALTLTLAAAPQVGDGVEIFQAAAGITGTIVNPNGGKINNTVGNMTIDVTEFSLYLTYVSAGYGWKVIA